VRTIFDLRKPGVRQIPAHDLAAVKADVDGYENR
jgi:hypothetical protein